MPNTATPPGRGRAGGPPIDIPHLPFYISFIESGFQPMKEAGRYRYVTRSVERALTILHLFILGEAEISLSDISHRVGLHQSTVFRLLATLGAAGFTEQNPNTGRYRLGPAALSLGQAFLRHSDLRQLAEASLAILRDRSGETVHLAILDGTEVLYLEKLPGLHPIGLMSSRVGDRSPAHCTGLGKALLAFEPEAEVRQLARDGLRSYTPRTITRISSLLPELATIREKGYAVDDEEHEVGVVCVAAPVFDSSQVVAAISASGPADRIRQEMDDLELTDQVLSAAVEISARLGRMAVPPGARPVAKADGRRKRAPARG
jgi:IclR family KDG regulon transcriptional repressor